MERHEHQLESIVGHGILKRLVKRFVESGTLPNAMILHGPSGLGKKSFAYALAKFINCTGERGLLACECPACRKIAHQTYIDLMLLKPEGPARTIRIEKIRELQDSALITPVEGKKKIVIVFDVERMSLGATNSILKILEEPPRHLITILTTNNLHNLLPTIRSRCMLLRFSPLPVKELKEWLIMVHKIDEKSAEMAAVLSEGHPGPALDMARGELQKRRENMVQELEMLERHGFAAIFRVAHGIATGSKDLATAMSDLLVWYRDLLVLRLVPEDKDLLINRDMAESLTKIAARYTPNGLYESCRSLLERQFLTQRIVPTTLALLVILNDIGMFLKKS